MGQGSPIEAPFRRSAGARVGEARPEGLGAGRLSAAILGALLGLAILTGIGLHALDLGGASLRTASGAAILLGLIAACALGATLIARAWPPNEADAGRVSHRAALAVEAARLGVFDWSLEQGAVRVSATMAALLGLEGAGADGQIAGEIDAEVVIDRFAEDFRPRLRAALAQAALDGELDASAPLARLADGAPIWIGLRGRGPKRETSGRFARITGVAMDLSRERLASLRAGEAEARLRDAIEAVGDAFVLFDRSGALIQCNDTFRRLFAIEPRVVKPGARRPYVLQFVRLALKGGATEDGDLEGERQLEDGRWLAIAERRTSEGGWVMTARDVTALKTQEEARRQNEEKLSALVRTLEASRREAAELARDHQAEKLRAEAANEAKSTFLANMSHELRTPLNAINGFSEMMVEQMFGPLGDKRYAQYAADILASGEHLLALINDVLDLAKVEAGKMRLHPETVELGEIARDAVRVVRRQATTAGATLDVELGHLPPVEVDYRAIKQVLLNLLSNAIRFTPRGGRIRLWAEPAGEGSAAVRVHVSDTGPGIAPEELGRLMQPFEQSAVGERGGPGTGLGLAVCRSLIELHGGALELESAPGEGFTARFTLPIARAETPRGKAA